MASFSSVLLLTADSSMFVSETTSANSQPDEDEPSIKAAGSAARLQKRLSVRDFLSSVKDDPEAPWELVLANAAADDYDSKKPRVQDIVVTGQADGWAS